MDDDFIKACQEMEESGVWILRKEKQEQIYFEEKDVFTYIMTKK